MTSHEELARATYSAPNQNRVQIRVGGLYIARLGYTAFENDLQQIMTSALESVGTGEARHFSTLDPYQISPKDRVAVAYLPLEEKDESTHFPFGFATLSKMLSGTNNGDAYTYALSGIYVAPKEKVLGISGLQSSGAGAALLHFLTSDLPPHSFVATPRVPNLGQLYSQGLLKTARNYQLAPKRARVQPIGKSLSVETKGVAKNTLLALLEHRHKWLKTPTKMQWSEDLSEFDRKIWVLPEPGDPSEAPMLEDNATILPFERPKARRRAS